VLQTQAGAPVLLLTTAAWSRCGLEAAEQLEPGLGWSLPSSACATSVVLLSSTYFSRRGSTANASASAPAGMGDTQQHKAAGRWSQQGESSHTHSCKFVYQTQVLSQKGLTAHTHTKPR
jgi:hypothetical protein